MPIHNNLAPPHAQDRAHRIVSTFLAAIADALHRRLDGDLQTLADMRCTLTAQMRDEIADIERTVLSEIRID